MEYNFKYAFTEDEYLDYSIYTTWSAPWQKKTRLQFLLKQVLMLIAIVAAYYWIDPQTKISLAVFIGIATTFIMIFCLISFVLVPNDLRKRGRKFVNKEENKHVLEENELTISETGLLNVDRLSTNKLSWDSIIRFARTKDSFYLYVNSQQALIIPNRLFKNEKEIHEFDQYVSQKVPLISSFRSLS